MPATSSLLQDSDVEFKTKLDVRDKKQSDKLIDDVRDLTRMDINSFLSNTIRHSRINEYIDNSNHASELPENLTKAADTLLKLLDSKELDTSSSHVREFLTYVHSRIVDVLNNSQQSQDLNAIIDKEKEPDKYELAFSLMKMPESERHKSLQTIFSKIPAFHGVRQDGNALAFLEKHWGAWIKLGWAIQSDVRKRSGSILIRQLDLEIKRQGLNKEDILPSFWTHSRIGQSLLTSDQERYAATKRRRKARKKAQQK